MNKKENLYDERKSNQIEEGEQLVTKEKVSKKELAIIGVIVAGAFVAILNQTILSPALPQLMESFNITAATAQWVTTIYMLVNGIMVPVTAYMIDRFSTKKLFITSMSLFVVGTAICGITSNFGILIVGRVLQAMGAGVQLPLVAYVPMAIFPKEKRGTAMGMAGIVLACAPAVGPVVAGWMIDNFGWRSMFISIIPLAAIITIVSGFILDNVGERKNTKLDIQSVVLSTIAFGGLLYGFSSASNVGWASVSVIMPIIIGAITLVWFVKRQLDLDEPLLELRILSNRTFAASAILVTIINAALAVDIILLPICLQTVLGCSAMVTGMLMAPAAIICIISSPISGMLFDKFGPRGVSLFGLLMMTISLFLLATAHPGSNILFMTFAYTLQSFGQTVANMPITTWGINALENQYIAHGNAISNTGRQVLGSISTAIIVTIMVMVTSRHGDLGVVLSTASGIRAAYTACGVVSLVGLIIAFVKVPKRGC